MYWNVGPVPLVAAEFCATGAPDIASPRRKTTAADLRKGERMRYLLDATFWALLAHEQATIGLRRIRSQFERLFRVTETTASQSPCVRQRPFHARAGVLRSGRPAVLRSPRGMPFRRSGPATTAAS